MSGKSVIKKALADYRENELISACKLYREKLSNEISEAAYYKNLERMCSSGELAKIAKGIYYVPKISKYGIVPLSEKELVSSFTRNRAGTVVGYSLYNKLGLTTQIPKTITVMSSAIESFTKSIRNIVIHQIKLDYTDEVCNMIHCLQVLQNFNGIQDINYTAFIDFAQSFVENYNDNVFAKVTSSINYKKSTISFLKEILEYHGKKNNLGMYLSSLSEYKHPKMEEIYEIARISK